MGTAAPANAGLFILTRFPQPGRTKTRLIPALGAEGAAQLQRHMTEFLIERLQGICHRRAIRFEIHFTGAKLSQMLDWLGHQVPLRPQGEGHLGQRIGHAFDQGFTSGLQRVLIIGSDCPSIGEPHIAQALTHLETHDLVLGPATDGGYYLVGLKGPKPQLFEGIRWGHSCVLEQTAAIATRQRLSAAYLPPLTDIDRPEDLPRYWEDFSSSPQLRL